MVWKTFQQFFGSKIKGKSQIALTDGNGLVTDDKALAKTLNKFLINVVSHT